MIAPRYLATLARSGHFRGESESKDESCQCSPRLRARAPAVSFMSTYPPETQDQPVNSPGELEPDLFSGATAEATPIELSSWQAQLTRRLHVLLHADPLLRMRRRDALQDSELRHYDSLLLALRVFDLIIERTGLEHEADQQQVAAALEPHLIAMDGAAQKEPDPERHAKVVDRLIGALRNDDGGRRAFKIRYSAFADNRVLRHHLEFKLLREHFHLDGRTVLRLSDQALNLFLNALDLDIEDAQAAAEAVVESQLKRGRFAEALQSANNALIQSVRYQTKVEDVLRDTRRDIRRVDWREDVPRLIETALDHIHMRVTVEQAIARSAEEKLATISPERPEFQQVAEIARLMVNCQRRHQNLHPHLLDARRVFRIEQDRQAFVPRASLQRPNLLAGVLEPMLSMRRSEASELVNQSAGFLFGARPAHTFSLSRLISWQLRPRRERRADPPPIIDPELEEESPDVFRYPEQVRERAEAYIATVRDTETLSAVLTRAAAAAEPESVLDAIAWLSLEAFAPDPEEGERPLLAIHAGRALDVAGFKGDDLTLIKE